ncbi:transcriptional regulator [Chromobacterium haemolyticum]|uniref:Transcriptional regulator n=1 Tax=Chromobacterium fluminis TaxID=3044269 RepID=A0ABX0L470_9NEIS|nr:Mor transcription activator family protein [Chromobacterium haemolyticum]NHR06505.1 transcriptional regulator [Chromobacterium haemolyticum]
MNETQHEAAMSRALHLLPENARHLVDIIGLATTLKLVNAFGGTHVSVPKTTRERGSFSALAEVVGAETARLLVRRYGDTRLYVPKCAAALRGLRDANIRADYDKWCRELGHNATVNNVLVPKYRLCDRRLEDILSKTDEVLPEAQGSLF